MAGSTAAISTTAELSQTKRFVLGLQHVAAMFGATVLVPIQTGLNPSVALLTAGLGTLLFHLVTKGKVPVFLGSSFAFIAAIQLVGQTEGLEYATGGIIAAGLVYNVEITEDNNVGIDLTLTTQACPLGPMLQMQAQYAIKSALPDVNQVDVRLVFDPPWTPDRMSERLKKARAMGLL